MKFDICRQMVPNSLAWIVMLIILYVHLNKEKDVFTVLLSLSRVSAPKGVGVKLSVLKNAIL